MNSLLDALHVAWVIGTKDILDALKNKSSRVNILIMVAMVFFFYWFGILRPFDKNISVVVYNEGDTNLAIMSTKLEGGATYTFREASSLEDMQARMSYQNLGLVLPAEFYQIRMSGGTPILTGYIFWADRMNIVNLEKKYSQAFSEILDQPVQVVIDQNIIIPQADADGMQVSVTYLMIYFVFSTALLLIPYLMMEEKQSKTLDALLISPASSGQVVLGKALAGFFYILVIGGLALALFSPFIANWVIALSAFLGIALLATGLGLAVGSFIKSRMELGLWTVLLSILVVIPSLFYMEPNLKEGIRIVLTWFPSASLASLFRFSCSVGVTPSQLWPNIAVALISIVAIFAVVVWKVRQSAR